jgi:FAD/FMN-containing dehydrogenase
MLITVAVQGITKADAAGVIGLLKRLSRACGELGGSVHLVKNVYAEPEDLRAMYAPAVAKFLELKKQLDPKGVLRNAFFDRLTGQREPRRLAA